MREKEVQKQRVYHLSRYFGVFSPVNVACSFCVTVVALWLGSRDVLCAPLWKLGGTSPAGLEIEECLGMEAYLEFKEVNIML